jgi:Ni,Fe-hydrogenase maturation factor
LTKLLGVGNCWYLDDGIGDFVNECYSQNPKERLKEICNNILKAGCDVYKGLFTNVLEKSKKK